MSRNEIGVRVHEAVAECVRGTFVGGTLYGVIGLVFLGPTATCVMFTGVSALVGCVKGAVKSQLESESHKLAADIIFGAVGYDARAAVTTIGFAAMPIADKAVMLGQQAVFGAINSIPYYYQSDLSDPILPIIAEGGEGALKVYLRHIGAIAFDEANDLVMYKSVAVGVIVGLGLRVLSNVGVFSEGQPPEVKPHVINVLPRELYSLESVGEVAQADDEL